MKVRGAPNLQHSALVLILVLALIAPPAHAVDLFEPDAGFPTSAADAPGDPPRVRDLEGVGGVADVDHTMVWTRPFRSYEVRLSNVGDLATSSALERRSYNGATLLQTGDVHLAPGHNQTPTRYLRWTTDFAATGFQALNRIRVSGFYPGATAAASTYTIQFRETTLFCPRFNNTGSQISVLIVQATHDGLLACSFTAYFRNEAGTILGQQLGDLDADGKLIVVSTATVAGVSGQKGSAHIAHTCGYGGLKAKLVALEPATGFSFDTPCTMREQ